MQYIYRPDPTANFITETIDLSLYFCYSFIHFLYFPGCTDKSIDTQMSSSTVRCSFTVIREEMATEPIEINNRYKTGLFISILTSTVSCSNSNFPLTPCPLIKIGHQYITFISSGERRNHDT